PESIEAMLQCHRRSRDRRRAENDHSRVPQREHEANCNWALSVLHQFPRYIVDRRNVIGVDGMTQTKTVSKKCSAHEHGVTVEGDTRPNPCADIEHEQNT